MLACGEEEYGGTDTQCGVGVSLHSRTHPLFMHVAQYGSVMLTSIRACFLCSFYNPYMPLFNSKNFSVIYTCTIGYNILMGYFLGLHHFI